MSDAGKVSKEKPKKLTPQEELRSVRVLWQIFSAIWLVNFLAFGYRPVNLGITMGMLLCLGYIVGHSLKHPKKEDSGER